MYATDARSTESGGFDLLPATDDPLDLGTWVRMEAETVTIPARGQADVPFTVEVPTDATPGDHVGGIVASVTSGTADTDGRQVAVDRRVATRVYLRVAGDLDPQLTLESVTVTHETPTNPLGRAPAQVTYRIRNTGNLRLGADQRIEVAGPFGLARQTLDLEPLPELLPGGSVTRTATVDHVRPTGKLTASVQLTPVPAPGDGADLGPLAPVLRSRSTWSVPWLGVLVVAGALGLLAWRVRARFRSP